MRVFPRAFCALLAISVAVQAGAEERMTVPDKKQTKAGLYLTAQAAAEMLQDGDVVLLDVRSRPEVTFVGIAERVDVHIPFMVMPPSVHYDAEARGYRLEANENFEFDFLDYAEERGLSDEAQIVIMCRSGTRSAKAANVLYDLGYEHVYSVIDGFEGDTSKEGPAAGHRTVNGWKNAGLAWTYTIRPEQAYPPDRM